MEKQLELAFQQLKAWGVSAAQAARAIGVSRRHFLKVKAGDVPATKNFKDKFKAAYPALFLPSEASQLASFANPTSQPAPSGFLAGVRKALHLGGTK